VAATCMASAASCRRWASAPLYLPPLLLLLPLLPVLRLELDASGGVADADSAAAAAVAAEGGACVKPSRAAAAEARIDADDGVDVEVGIGAVECATSAVPAEAEAGAEAAEVGEALWKRAMVSRSGVKVRTRSFVRESVKSNGNPNWPRWALPHTYTSPLSGRANGRVTKTRQPWAKNTRTHTNQKRKGVRIIVVCAQQLCIRPQHCKNNKTRHATKCKQSSRPTQSYGPASSIA
jgi:hypothetical protein